MTTVSLEPQQKNDTISLFKVGSLVNLRIRSWSGRKMLTRSDMVTLGYNPDKLPQDIVNLGRKLMVPKHELQAINQVEQRGRKALERWSVPFGIASAHFIPRKMLPTVDATLKDLKDEFFTKVDSFISRFDELVSSVKNTHPEFWEKCLKHSYPANPKLLREKFQFDWFTFKIAGLDAIQETSIDDEIARETVIDEKTKELKTQMQKEVGKFVGEYVSAMRNETIRFCDLMTARILGKPFANEDDVKNLTPKSISSFKKYVDRFKSMNIFGDSEIEKMLSEFKNSFLGDNVSPKDFDSINIKDSVTKSLEAIRNKAASEGDDVSGFIGELKRKIVL